MSLFKRLRRGSSPDLPRCETFTGSLPITDYSERLAKAKAQLGTHYALHPQSTLKFVTGPSILQGRKIPGGV